MAPLYTACSCSCFVVATLCILIMFDPKYIDHESDVTVETTELFPSHFLVKIKSFSTLLLVENGVDKYESTEFEAGGYKWKIVIYLHGDNVAVDLCVADQTTVNWEVNATFSIFLRNHIADNFLCKRARGRRFHVLAPSCGFSNFISKNTLKDPSSGFLVEDACVFGAEVFVLKKPDVFECVSLAPKTEIHSITIPNYSKIKDYWNSESFTAGGKSWFVRIYPKGYGKGKGSSCSIFLYLVDYSASVQAKYTLRMKDQTGNKHRMYTGNQRFAKSVSSWGFHSFIPIAYMSDPDNGFVVNDCCIVEVEISVLDS